MASLSRSFATGKTATSVLKSEADESTNAAPPGKLFRIGVVSAAIRGKPQPRNGHTWHFAQYLHPTANLDVIQKMVDPGSAEIANPSGVRTTPAPET